MSWSPQSLDIAELSRSLPSGDSMLALLAFEREGDMVRAARMLGLSQPALSFQLKKLERTLGFQLFSFSGKRKVLTQLGRAYVEKISRVYQELHLTHERMAREAIALDHQKIRIAGRRELFLPLLSFPFPGQMEFLQMSSSEALRALREHRVDLSISAQTLDSGDLVAKVFFESSFKLIYPEAWQSRLSAGDELKQLPVVVYGNHHAYLEDYLAWKGWRFESLKVSRIVEDWFSVVELVKHGLGWAIIPEGWGVHAPGIRMQSLKSESVPKQRIYIFHRRDDRKAAWIQGLEKWLLHAKKALNSI